MKKNLLLTLALCLLAQGGMAQTPKWVEKAKRAVFSIVTYDKNDKILNTGNGFFATEDGIALSDCSLFKGAQRAMIIDSEGREMPVSALLGANDMYDVIKFRVSTTDKKVAALPLASSAPMVGAEVYLLPYSTQKDRSCTQGKITAVSKLAEKYAYYTLSLPLKDKLVSCPLMTADGQVFGLAQKSSGKDSAAICYAADATFAFAQAINALSMSDATLQNIGIKKGLPDTEEQALIFLYMASSQTTPEEYKVLLDDYIRQYPNSADGYIRRANNRIYLAKEDAGFASAAADIEQALKVSQNKDDVHYNFAKMIYAYQLNKPDKTYQDWTFNKALEQVRSAEAINPQPVYQQLEGDILFAKQDYAGALVCYEKVNTSNLASAATYFNTAKTKELMKADSKEVLALMDSCLARCIKPLTADAAPYLLERAQMYMNTEQFRLAMLDYDAYYDAVNGQVNDVFYFYREQAAFKAKQFQRALDDIAKAIELNQKDLTYRAEQAVVNLRVGRYDTAVKVLTEAVKLDPKYAEAYRLLGICQLQQKKNAEACTNFSKAKELGDPNVEELIKKHCNNK
ncbi:MAG: tetratricopeptide repeat protein [Bacteroides sp.]